MGTSRTHRLAFAAVVATAVTLGLAGCVGGAAMPTPTGTPSASPSGSTTNTPDPKLRPGESAVANQQYFDFVNSAFYATNGKSDGRSIIDNLVAAGFLKQDMELTPDTTAIGIPVDSIVFSVRVNDECLIGQFTASAYTGAIGPLLGTGACLVGKTRTIDW